MLSHRLRPTLIFVAQLYLIVNRLRFLHIVEKLIIHRFHLVVLFYWIALIFYFIDGLTVIQANNESTLGVICNSPNFSQSFGVHLSILKAVPAVVSLVLLLVGVDEGVGGIHHSVADAHYAWEVFEVRRIFLESVSEG